MKMIRKALAWPSPGLRCWPAPPRHRTSRSDPDVDGPDRARRRNADQVRRRIQQDAERVQGSRLVQRPISRAARRAVAFRAGNPPHIMQMFDAGSGDMMGASKIIVPVSEVFKRAGMQFNPVLHRAGPWLLRPEGWQPAVDAVQRVHLGAVLQQRTCCSRGGARRQQTASHLA